MDKAYDNVILHVVWEHDTDVFRKDNSKIPTLELKGLISETSLVNYKNLFSKSKKWVNCENDLPSIDAFVVQNWLERLYFERLERKSLEIEGMLAQSKNDWEAVLFKMLMRSFGLKVNGESFLSIANSIDFSIVRKVSSNQTNLESLFLGQAGLLEGKEIQDQYYLDLVNEYQFLKQKFKISRQSVFPIKFFRLRPLNFPTIRLSQLATLYSKEYSLFSEVIKSKNTTDIYNIFLIETSLYWESHYTFFKDSKKSRKVLTKNFMDLLIINTIVPLKFAYAKHQGKDIEEEIVELISSIAFEKNSIVDKFKTLKIKVPSALESQGVLQLKSEYCNKNKCLQCAIGSSFF